MYVFHSIIFIVCVCRWRLYNIDTCGFDGQFRVDHFLPEPSPSATSTWCHARGEFLAAKGGDSRSMSAIGASLCVEVEPAL